jgi:uncharacterized protein (TIGR03435 family)
VSSTIVFCLLLALAAVARGADRLTFEVASVKVATSGINGYSGGCHGVDSVYSAREQAAAPPLGRCVIRDARLSHLIAMAYGVTVQNLKTGPDWIQFGDLRFDVDAKAEDPSKATRKQLLTMLQNLLVERFQLKFHYETTDVPGFALTVGKNGPKLKPTTSEDSQMSFKGPKGEPVLKPDQGVPLSMTARKCSIAGLVSVLTFIGSHGPGVDKTGLTGEYDFALSWDEENGPALPAALRDQLGLRMEAEKIPVATLVVDSAQKPTAN